MTKYEHAKALAAQGFDIFPIAAGANAPPLIKDWPNKAAPNADYWDLIAPDANIAIHCKGMCVVDIDVKKGGTDTYQSLKETYGWPDTRTCRTPSGGGHLYYRLPPGHPGVSNSVEVLGAGVDVRSTNGYVAAPGSTRPDGEYIWLDTTVPIAPVPEWLLSRLDTIVPKMSTIAPKTGTIPDADETTVGKARDWLRTAQRSVKGRGGDQRAYEVACGVRDFGLSYQQACELMRSEVWDYGCGWREGRLEEKPIASAYRYAQNEPGVRVAQAADFPPVQATSAEQDFSVDAPVSPTGEMYTQGEQKQRKSNQMKSLAQLAADDTKGAGYLIKGLLQKASYAELYGAPGEGKTFGALDMAYHVAAGMPWMGKRTKQGPVLYLAYEGFGGLRNRAKALRQKYGDADVPLFIVNASFNLREQQGRKELAAILAGMEEKPAFVVIDTLARALMGGDENSAQDIGAFNTAIAALIEHTQACVMILHHSGKDKSKGARGSSALLGALDTEIEMDAGAITSRKQRDVDLGDAIGFRLVPVMVGVDEDDEPVMSCVLESADPAAPLLKERLAGNQKRGFDALCGITPGNKKVDVATWRDACRDFLGDKNVNQRFFDIKKGLMMKGYVGVDEFNLVQRKLE